MKPRIEQGIVLCPKCGFTADKESINFYRRQKRQLHHQKIVLEARLKLWTQTRVLPLSQLRQLNVLNAEIGPHSGGCCRRDPLMKRLHNSIGVQDVAIHGEIIPNSTTNFIFSYRLI